MSEISIIIPVYNIKREYLDSCIESLINQTFKDIEILIVDDGSDYECAKLCDEYKKIDKRIKCIHQKNQGVSVARNTGIDNSTGRWITFVDPDDWVEIDMCEKIFETIKNGNHDSDIIIFSYEDNYINKKIPRYWGEGDVYILSKKENELLQLGLLNPEKKFISVYFGAVWCNFYKNSFLQKNNIRFIEGLKKSQDTVFNLYATQYANKIVYLNKILYHYRHNDTSVCYKYNPNIDNSLFMLINEIEFFLEKFNKFKNLEFKKAYYYKGLITILENLNLNYFHSENNLSWSLNRKKYLELLNKSPYKEIIKEYKGLKLPFKKNFIFKLIKNENYYLVKIFFVINNNIQKLKNKTY